MIYLYTGTPGSGKSLHMARDIVDFCSYGKKDKLVLVNFPVKVECLKHPERLCYIPQDDLTPKAIISKAFEYWGHNTPQEGRVKVFIDESQLIFNSREWQKSGRSDWIALFTQHRKLGLDIYLVAQFDEMIDKQIRSLVEFHVVHRKVSNFGKLGFLCGLFTSGLFVAVYRWYGINEKVSHEYFVARKKYYQIYDTLTLFYGSLDLNNLVGDVKEPEEVLPPPAPASPT